MSPRPILTVEEFYVHALAIEREAAQRYREFEAHFAERGDDVLAGLCRNLAQLENEHLELLVKSSADMTLPAIDAADHRWLDAGSPEAPAREPIYRIADAQQLLEIALQAEWNAFGFFKWVAHTAPDSVVRALARDMADDEKEHVRWVQRALEYQPASRKAREIRIERNRIA